MLDEYELLKAIRKGSFPLKIKKLLALDFIRGSIPKLDITPDGEAEIERLKNITSAHSNDLYTALEALTKDFSLWLRCIKAMAKELNEYDDEDFQQSLDYSNELLENAQKALVNSKK